MKNVRDRLKNNDTTAARIKQSLPSHWTRLCQLACITKGRECGKGWNIYQYTPVWIKRWLVFGFQDLLLTFLKMCSPSNEWATDEWISQQDLCLPVSRHLRSMWSLSLGGVWDHFEWISHSTRTLNDWISKVICRHINGGLCASFSWCALFRINYNRFLSNLDLRFSFKLTILLRLAPAIVSIEIIISYMLQWFPFIYPF